MRFKPTLSVIWIVIAFLIIGCAGHGSVQDPVEGPAAKPAIVSGLQRGDDIIPWNPIHVSGPNAGTNACPVCTYGERPAVVIFAKDGPSVAKIAEKLETLVVTHQDRQLKGFLIVLDTTPEALKQKADAINARHIGICYPDSATLAADLKAYKISPAADNTVMIYANYKVISNFVNVPVERFDEVAKATSDLH